METMDGDFKGNLSEPNELKFDTDKLKKSIEEFEAAGADEEAIAKPKMVESIYPKIMKLLETLTGVDDSI